MTPRNAFSFYRSSLKSWLCRLHGKVLFKERCSCETRDCSPYVGFTEAIFEISEISDVPYFPTLRPRRRGGDTSFRRGYQEWPESLKSAALSSCQYSLVQFKHARTKLHQVTRPY